MPADNQHRRTTRRLRQNVDGITLNAILNNLWNLPDPAGGLFDLATHHRP
jgi:hypothetical protein